jgi:predicted restriction endonuclease
LETNNNPQSFKTEDESDSSIENLILNRTDILEKLLSIETENIRMSNLAKLLNVRIKTLTIFFKKAGFGYENNPMTKVSNEVLQKVIKETIEKKVLSDNMYSDIINKPQNDLNKKNLYKTISTITHPNAQPELLELEKKIIQIENTGYVKSIVLQQFLRNGYVKEYARIRAEGKCELCEQIAPFNDIKNKPFLEVHHIIWLSKGGQDSIDNVAALCPNCHRKIHNLNLEIDVESLIKKRTKD